MTFPEKTMMKTRHSLHAAGLLCSGVSQAMTVAPVNLEHLVDHAERAFVCTVDASDIVEVAEGRLGERITVTVSRPVLGEVSAQEKLSWMQYRSAQAKPLAGMPQYETGVSYLVFLSAAASGSPYQSPVAMGQGVFRVSEDKATGTVSAANQYNNEYLWARVDMETVEDAQKAAQPATQLDSIIAATQALAADKAVRADKAPAAIDMDHAETSVVVPSIE